MWANTFTRVLVLCMLLPLLGGCTAVVRAPSEATSPRTVQLLQHARHTSLLLTAADQTRLRYAYGDWAWYVEGDEGLMSGARALFIPSPAGLGRRVIGPAQPGETIGQQVGVAVDSTYRFTVEATRVDALIDSLEREFHASAATPRFNVGRGLTFVPHPRPYTFVNNSNHMVAEWLRALGFEVKGNPALGFWQLEAAEPDSADPAPSRTAP